MSMETSMTTGDVANTQSTGYHPFAGQEADTEARQRIRPAPMYPSSETEPEIETEYDSEDSLTGYHDAFETRAPDIPDQVPQQPRVNWKSVLMWSGVSVAVLALASFIWWFFTSGNSHQGGKEDKKKESFWTGFKREMPMVITLIVMYVGSLRVLNAGKRMSVAYLSRDESRLGNFFRREDAPDKISLLAAALIPLWAPLLSLPDAGTGRCRDAWNPYIHLPAKTNKDIRAVLDVWWKFMNVEGRLIFGLSQSFKQHWIYSFRNMAVIAVALTGWTVLEAFKGPCWTFTRVYWIWNPSLTAIVACFLVEKREALIFKPKLWPWAELVLFLGTLYLGWTSPLNVYCDDSRCW